MSFEAERSLMGDYFISYFFHHISILIRTAKRCYVVFEGVKPDLKKHRKGYWWAYKRTCRKSSFHQAPSRKGWIFQYGSLYYELIDTIIENLQAIDPSVYHPEHASVITMRSPFEGDHQIVKLFQENLVDCVFSRDYGFLHYGMPLMIQTNPDRTCEIIDLETQSCYIPSTNQRLEWYVQETKGNLDRKAIFAVLIGKSYIERFLALVDH